MTEDFLTFTQITVYNSGLLLAYVLEINTVTSGTVQTWLILIMTKHHFGREKKYKEGAMKEWKKRKSEPGVNSNSLFSKGCVVTWNVWKVKSTKN